MTTVLITGAAGYIGSHVTVAALDAGYNVVAVDNCVNASPGDETIPPSLQRVQEITGKTLSFYKIDLLDKESVRAIFSKYNPECIIHTAALKNMAESVKNPLPYYRNNIGSLLTILEIMKEFNVKKIVFSSSALVYGTPEYNPIDERHPVGKTCTNPYAKTKYFCEEILKDACAADKDLTAVALRYFSPVGAHESGRIGEDPLGPPSQLMAIICQIAVGRRPQLAIFGNDFNTADGTVERDYIHVMDLAKGSVAPLNKMNEDPNYKGFKAYNLGMGKGYSVLQLIKAFSKESGKKIPYTIGERRGIDVAQLFAHIGLAEKDLGWKPRQTLEDMCRDTWRWQSNNPQGYRTSK
ncbi:UDP-glucose 4-epimerase-like [Limulus polyphemus]|uniref:UDP-glucose 4-epimerase n=1 Tax=Limulus polyphemus TaxID=6850 RepID=A0ABM1B0G4_LIMPO|nr:UDP-glucose 4-epimerase-like [Limulus polyphemus]